MSVVETEQTTVVEQARYHQDKAMQVVFLALLSIPLAVGVVGLLILLRDTIAPPPTYFSVMANGALFPEKPLDEPSVPTNELLNKVTEVMMQVNTFNFIDYNTVMDEANEYFTKEGYQSYKDALTTANVVSSVIEKKYVLTAVATDAPQLLLEKPFAGRYMWKIRIPMRFRYQNVTTDFGRLVEITLIVMRVPTTQSPNGALVLKYDLEDKGVG